MKNTTIQKNTVKPRTLSGVVTSNRMKDTAVVQVSRFVKHQKYDKYIQISKKFKAHDAGNTASIGDTVTIVETRPISKDKHFTIKK